MLLLNNYPKTELWLLICCENKQENLAVLQLPQAAAEVPWPASATCKLSIVISLVAVHREDSSVSDVRFTEVESDLI